MPAPAAVRSDAIKLGACRFLCSSAEVEGISVLPPVKGDDTADEDTSTLLGTEGIGQDANHNSLTTAETTSRTTKKVDTSTELNRWGRHKPPHFLSPVNMSEGQLSQPPLQLLHNEYRASGIMHGVDFEDCYTFTEMELDGRTVYHSTFTCPGTGCTFHSGTPFQSRDFPGLPGSADDCVTFTAQRKDGSSSSSSALESRTFYGSRKVAQHAAAARAIDCISHGEYRRFNGDEVEIGEGDVFRFCSEEPYMPPPFSVSSAATSTTTPVSSSVVDHITPVSKDDCYFLSPKGMTFTGPAEFLNNNMDKFHPEISVRRRKESKFRTYSIMDDQRRRWWTATYTDPLSGQVFKSGIIKSDPTPPYESSRHEPKVQDDKVYYAQKKVAVSAAAARAIDCLSVREFKKQRGEDAIPGDEDVTRLCVEEPFTDFDYKEYELESESDKHNYFLSPRFIKFSHPKDTLHNHMRKFHPDLLVDWKDKCFQTELVASMDGGVRTNLDESVGEGEWWTATYRDPLSGRTFEAGTLTDYYKKPTAFQRHGASRNINGKVCYEQESRAESAAAARAIDCLSLREFQKQRGEDAVPSEKDVLRICVEEPFTDFEYSTYEERSRKQGLVSENADYFMSRRGPHAIPFYSAKDFLARNYLRYRGRMGRSKKKIGHYLTATSKGDCEEGEYWWTATFKCPETGEEFASGKLRSGVSPSEMKVIDDDVCYKNQKMAEHAACSRAIDSFSFREFLKRRDTGFDIDENNIMRLCEEEPYLPEIKQPSVVQSASQSPSSTPQRITLPLSLTNADIPVYSRGSAELDTHISATVADNDDEADERDSMLRVYDNLDDAEYAEDDHVVQLLPGTPFVYNAQETPAAASAVFGIPTTMERILAAWAETPSTISTDAKATIGGSELVPVENRLATMESVSNALAWFHRLEDGNEASNNALVDKNPKFEPKLTVGTLRRMPVSVAACNTILRALADENATLSFHDQSTLDLSIDSGFQIPCIDKDTGYIESLAKEVLDRVQHTNTEEKLSPTSTSRRPNLETFNALIGCIRRRTSFDTAVAAESVLNRMLNEKEDDMPGPNVDTFNTVIDLWAAVPGKQGRKKVEELFSKMTAESLGDDSTLRPNRNTFISALHGLTQSACSDGANSDFTFAEDDAKNWIERMKVLAAEYGDESLLPDTEVYNAPLRWSGSFGQRAGNWDDYASIYKDGFVDESVTTFRDKDAEAMERWLLDMEELSKDNPRIHPTIESYESIIQAWVRTGLYKGVLRAEEWAKRAIEAASAGASNQDNASDLRIYPRFQTFHPIIAAWAYCGHPERVKQWDDTLEGLGIGNLSELKPDGRIKAALIVAWRERQRLYSEENAATDSTLQAQERVNASFDAAKTCMGYLEDLCALAQGQVKNECSPFAVFDASSAEQVVDSWGAAAHLAASCSGELDDSASATSTFALEEMFRTIALIDELIDTYRTAPLSGINQETAKKYQYHKNHFMSRSAGLCAKVIGHIHELDSESTSRPSLFPSFLPDVEKLLRRSEFYDVALIPQGPSARKERREFRNTHEVLRYADSFSYDTLNSQSDDVQTSRHHHYDLFSNILHCCGSLDSPSQYGDAIRLIMFIQKHILISKRKCIEEENLSKLNQQVIDLVNTLVTDETEKAAMLKIIHRGVKSEHSRSEEDSDVLDDDCVSNISQAEEMVPSQSSSEVTKLKKRVIMKRRFPTKKGKRATRAGGSTGRRKR